MTLNDPVTGLQVTFVEEGHKNWSRLTVTAKKSVRQTVSHSLWQMTNTETLYSVIRKKICVMMTPGQTSCLCVFCLRVKFICLSIYSASLCGTMQQQSLHKETSLWDSNDGGGGGAGGSQERRGGVRSRSSSSWFFTDSDRKSQQINGRLDWQTPDTELQQDTKRFLTCPITNDES